MAPLRFIKLWLWLWLAALCVASATDHISVVDFCIADPNPVMVNGLLCKDPEKVQADDFFFSGLHIPRNTTNALGVGSIRIDSDKIPGLNALGLCMARIDLAPGAGPPPHYHPGATEVIFVLEGRAEAGFVTSNPEYRLITKVLEKGDVFVFPEGLVHFQRNAGEDTAVVFTASSSDYPRAAFVSNVAFGSNPAIPKDILAKAFRADDDIVEQILSKF